MNLLNDLQGFSDRILALFFTERIFMFMKPLEIAFFKVVLMTNHITFVRYIVNIFCDLGYAPKQLWYYLQKWSSKGFYDYGVTLDLGWIETDKLVGEYKKIYDEMKQGGNCLDYEYIRNILDKRLV